MEEDVSEIVVPGPSYKPKRVTPKDVQKDLKGKEQKNLAAAEKKAEETNARNKKFNNMEEGCGDAEELPWVEIDGGKLTASDDSEQSLADIVRTGNAWKDMGIEIIGGREDVLSALGVEITASEPLPQLMDEEPPLEE
tara:strand:+ start:1662 stop:2075 length:414 start_codon:yes stop_codon:yes gene_type:complete